MPARVGHAPTIDPYKARNPVLKALLWPLRLYHYLIYTSRPDVVHLRTRRPQWRALQSQWRWAHAIVAYLGPPSHLLWHIKAPLLANLAMAALIMGATYVGMADIGRPATVAATTLIWRLSTFMLALLLAFRVGRTYDRWWLARTAFSSVGGAAFNVATMAVTWVPDPLLRAEILRWATVWQPSVYHYVIYSTLEAAAPRVAALLDADELALYNSQRKPRNLVVLRLRQLIAKANLEMGQFMQMDAALNAGVSAQGTCARILTQAMPYSITLMCSGFMEIWLLLLPLGLFSQDRGTNPGHNFLELVLYALVCVLMLGIDEASNQLEQPFAFLPLGELLETSQLDIHGVQESARKLEELGASRMHRRAELGNGSIEGAAEASSGAGNSESAVGDNHIVHVAQGAAAPCKIVQ